MLSNAIIIFVHIIIDLLIRRERVMLEQKTPVPSPSTVKRIRSASFLSTNASQQIPTVSTVRFCINSVLLQWSLDYYTPLGASRKDIQFLGRWVGLRKLDITKLKVVILLGGNWIWVGRQVKK